MKLKRTLSFPFLACSFIAAYAWLSGPESISGAPFPPPSGYNLDEYSSGYAPLVRCDGEGVCIALCSVVAPGGDQIILLRSVDAGSSWSAPTLLFQSQLRGEYTGDNRDLVSDGNGGWLAVWSTADPAYGGGGEQEPGYLEESDIVFSASADGGLTWSAAAPLHSNAASDTGWDRVPSAAMAADGHWNVVWSTTEPAFGGIPNYLGSYPEDVEVVCAYTTNSGASWSRPVPVESTALNEAHFDGYLNEQLRIGLSPGGGTVFVAGIAYVANELFLYRSTDQGANWGEREILDRGYYSPKDGYDLTRSAIDMDTDGNGRWVIAYESNNYHEHAGEGDAQCAENDIMRILSSDDGLTWSPPGPLNGTGPLDNPRLYDGSLSGQDYSPKIEAGGNGQWLAVWQMSNPCFGGGPFMVNGCNYNTESFIAFSRSVDHGVTWTYPELLWRDPATSDTRLDRDYYPALAYSRGNWIVSWYDFITNPDPDLWYDRFLYTSTSLLPPAHAYAADFTSPTLFASSHSPSKPFSPASPAGASSAGWTGGLLAGSGLAFLGAGSGPGDRGLCLNVPPEGDNLLGWVGPAGIVPLTDQTVYRARVTVSTDQLTTDALPLWSLIYNNANPSGPGNTYGGEAWFLEAAGGAAGIGRPPAGRTVFETWAAPAAALTPQWRGTLPDVPNDSPNPDNANGAFTAEADAFNDMAFQFRVNDPASGGINAGFDSGTICLERIVVDAFPMEALCPEEAVWDAAITSATFAAQTAAQEAEGAGTAFIDEAAGAARYRLTASGPGSRKSLLPWDPTRDNGANLNLQLYPLTWAPESLYRGVARIRSDVNLDGRGPGLGTTEGVDPADSIFLVFDTPTVELGQVHYVSRGAPGNFDRAGSPRLPVTAGGAAQEYVGYFYSHAPTFSLDPDAARFRLLAEFFNAPEIAPHGHGGDPLAVERLTVYRVPSPP